MKMIPNWEYEIVDGVLTGRVRKTQFQRTMRYQAVPPSMRAEMCFK